MECTTIDLAEPKRRYDVTRAQRANAGETNFSGRDGDDSEALERHTVWQSTRGGQCTNPCRARTAVRDHCRTDPGE
jgi:hypothetical protein